MGTNYYARTGDSNRPLLHIGKSSMGWCFALHVMNMDESGTVPLTNLNEWMMYLGCPGIDIVDEYFQEYSLETFMDIVTNRAHWSQPSWDEATYEQNHAEPGPNNLARSKIDGTHCIGHGPGTWDLIINDFT